VACPILLPSPKRRQNRLCGTVESLAVGGSSLGKDTGLQVSEIACVLCRHRFSHGCCRSPILGDGSETYYSFADEQLLSGPALAPTLYRKS
jgi:hypothetical protein